MSKSGDIYLGALGSEVLITPFGRKLQISDVEFSRSERTASGRLVKDVYAVKKKIKLVYSEIDGDALEAFLDLYDNYDELSILIYHTNDGSTTTTTPAPEQNYDQYTVIMEPIDRERVLLKSADYSGMWAGVTIELNEV